MKILHLLYESRGDYFGVGGVGERAYQIYDRLKSRHDITLLCKKYPGAKDGFIDGLRHVFIGTESGSLTKTLLSYAHKASLYARTHHKDFDIIIEEFSPATPTFLSFFIDTPIVLQVQGYTGLLYFNKYNPIYSSALYLLEHVRPRFYCNFIFINRHTIDKLGLNHKSNAAIIPNGVYSEAANLPYSEGGYILYLGRIDIYGKGLDLLIKAYDMFARTDNPMRLVIAGDGRDMEKFRDMIRALPKEAADRIELLGWVSGDAKSKALHDASCFVLPSRHEVQGIAVLEAMAAGKAVITSDIEEFSYIPSINAGICFKSGDPESLAAALTEITSRTDREKLGANGRGFVKDLSWDRAASDFEKFIEETAFCHSKPAGKGKIIR